MDINISWADFLKTAPRQLSSELHYKASGAGQGAESQED